MSNEEKGHQPIYHKTFDLWESGITVRTKELTPDPTLFTRAQGILTTALELQNGKLENKLRENLMIYTYNTMLSDFLDENLTPVDLVDTSSGETRGVALVNLSRPGDFTSVLMLEFGKGNAEITKIHYGSTCSGIFIPLITAEIQQDRIISLHSRIGRGGNVEITCESLYDT